MNRISFRQNICEGPEVVRYFAFSRKLKLLRLSEQQEKKHTGKNHPGLYRPQQRCCTLS